MSEAIARVAEHAKVLRTGGPHQQPLAQDIEEVIKAAQAGQAELTKDVEGLLKELSEANAHIAQLDGMIERLSNANTGLGIASTEGDGLAAIKSKIKTGTTAAG